METSGDASNNWIPTSFSGTSETGMETGDSLSSYQSAATPGSAVAIDQQSIDDLSFDAISRQKLSLTGLGTVPEPTSPKNNNNAPPGMFEEDTRSSWSGEPPKPTTFKETALDGEDSQNSIASNSQKSALEAQLPASTSPKQDNVEEEEVEKVVSFPPENLFEYMWPQESNEFFFLQEQVSDYLNVKSFKRKYPDLVRRIVDMAEKQFLKDRGVVTEVQCDLGLTALRSEEVLELMNKDYPDQYKEYIRVLREKEQQSIKEKRIEYIATNSDKTRMVDLVKKAVQSAAEYNAHLNQERREERKSCMDLQTYTVHYPCKTSTKMKETPKMGKYPVALLPGQFQDFYKQYSPDELKYLPINTVLYGPLKELNSVKASASDGSPSDSDDSSASEESCDSSSRDSSSAASEPEKTGSKPSNGKPDAVCKVCKRGPELNRELVHCADCDSSAHPNCIELTADVVDVLKTYPWQCMDCKVCSHCKDPDDEDRMLFCDICDRGYHTFCVGLKTLPQQGKWVCRKCGSCSLCGAAKPGPETATKTAQWQYEAESDPNRRPKIFCQACFKKRR